MKPFDTQIATRLATDGWVHLPGVGATALDPLIEDLGVTVLHTTDVVVRDGRALITSDRAIDFHTDHHRAELIAWRCLVQTTRGGHTRLADAQSAFASLAPQQRRRLESVRLFEHSVFPGDAATHPVVEYRAERPRFYCSFWFEAPSDPEDAAALSALRAAIKRHVVADLRLASGDVLLIDNRRVLHARTAITGSRNRHLVRHWLAASG